MLFPKSAVIALVTSPVILGSPLLKARQGTVSCQTSSGSPTSTDVTAVINQLRGRGDSSSCKQSNGKASDCTTIAKQGSAAVSMCGEKFTMTCAEVADHASQIQQSCLDGAAGNPDTRTGGTFQISASERIEVH